MIDLLVAGGGPVGLAVAIRARLAGLSVVVADPREDPIEKACGEGLMPSAVSELAELGVRPEGRSFIGIHYVCGQHEARARFSKGSGMGVRRVMLHAALAARAAELGVVRERLRVAEVAQHDGAVEAAGLTAGWLIAADGLHSPVRRNLGLDRPIASRPVRFGYRRHYSVVPWSEYVEVHWARSTEAYVTAVDENTVGVAVLGGPRLEYDEVLREFPRLVECLGAASSGKLRAAGPLRQRALVRRLGRVLLVGDAAGYVDALTGEGIATGLATAKAAVDCIVADRPQDYDAAWMAATRRYRTLTGALLSASQRPVLRRQIVPAAERLPRVFGHIVNLLA